MCFLQMTCKCNIILQFLRFMLQNLLLTFPDHRHSDGHPHELALGPHVRVHTHPPLLAFSIEAGHGWMVGHLLRREAHLVGLLGGGWVGASL